MRNPAALRQTEIPKELVALAQDGDTRALELIIRLLHDTLYGEAKRLAGSNECLVDDLVGTGMSEIWECLPKYNPAKSQPKTFFTRRIAWVQLAHFNNYVGGGTGIGTTVRSAFDALSRECDGDYGQMRDRASEFGISLSSLVSLTQMGQGLESFDAYMENEDDECPAHPIIFTPDSDPDPLQAMLLKEEALRLRELLSHEDIPAKWGLVIEKTSGINGVTSSDKELSAELHVSESRVRSLRSLAARRMREIMERGV